MVKLVLKSTCGRKLYTRITRNRWSTVAAYGDSLDKISDLISF